MNLISVSPACLVAAGLRPHKVRHFTRLAERTTADGLLVFNPAHAFYQAYRDLFAGCTGPAPTEAAVAAVRAMEPAPVVAAPYADWPAWAKLVAKRRRDGEAGIGDTFERIASSVGGKRFEAWATRRGINCGCKARRAKWNRQYPYGTTTG